MRTSWNFEVNVTLPTKAKRWFPLPHEGRHVKIEVFHESLWSLHSNEIGGFQGRSKSEKGCPRTLKRSPVECLSDAKNLWFHYCMSTRAFEAKPEIDMYFYAKQCFHCYTSAKWLSKGQMIKMMKFQSPYGVTGKGKAVISRKWMERTHENHVFQESLWS